MLWQVYAQFCVPSHRVQLRPACDSVASWLAADAENVAVIHCKAGKGRTGVMIAAFLVHCGACTSADAALALFARRRTFDGKGVTIPSQQRYVRYYALQVRLRAMGKGGRLAGTDDSAGFSPRDHVRSLRAGATRLPL